MSGAPLSFRPARPGDEAAVLRAVRGIAAAERLDAKLTATEADYTRLLFGDPPALRALIVERGADPVAVVTWHDIVSTFTGRLGLYVEDVCVEESCRGQGIGTAVFRHLAQFARRHGYERVQWWVKKDNTPAVAFYDRLGAERLSQYTVLRLDGPRLDAMADS